VGDLRLFLLGQLCEGLCLVRHEEYGVIAETALPHGGKSDGAGSLPLGGDGVVIVSEVFILVYADQGEEIFKRHLLQENFLQMCTMEVL